MFVLESGNRFPKGQNERLKLIRIDYSPNKRQLLNDKQINFFRDCNKCAALDALDIINAHLIFTALEELGINILGRNLYAVAH